VQRDEKKKKDKKPSHLFGMVKGKGFLLGMNW